MWEVFKDWIFNVIAWFYSFCGDWGLAIIIITIIFRLIMAPLMHKQQKSTYQTQKMQPEINRIKERFPDDKQRQNEEIQKIYAASKYNPLAGCVPMLIQIPIFMALFQTLQEMGTKITDGSSFCFYGLVPDLVMTPAEAFSIDMGTFVPYLILMLVFAFATFIPMLFQEQSDPSQRKTMIAMAIVMSLMMLWLGWSSPAGVLLFWGMSSLMAIGMNAISKKILKSADAKAAAEAVAVVKPVEVDVVRKQKKKRQSKKR